MKHSVIFCVFVFLLGSCTSPEPRRPVTQKSYTTLATTTESLKKLNTTEDTKIKAYIENDSLYTYINSQEGYWYAYETKVAEDQPKPQVGDRVIFEYSIADLFGNEIYSAATLGEQSYVVDKQDLISALQSGIKLMHVGETLIFAIPSYQAFGLSGDGDKIGINQSIICKVTLKKIIKIELHEN